MAPTARPAGTAARTVWAVAAAGALLASGCGHASRETTVRFWGLGREGEVVQPLLRAFERSNPGVRVETQQIPFTAAHEKILTAFVGGSTPDVAQLGNTWIPELVALDALEPLGPRLARSSVKPVDFFPGIWATNEIDGEPFGVPWYVDTRVLFYRSDLFAQAGVSRPPRSWEEWRDDLRRVETLPGGERYGVLLPIDEWAQPVVFALQAHADLLAEGGRRGDFRDPAFRRAFDFYVSLFKERLAPPLGIAQVANPYQQFADGYFASWITGPWNLSEFRNRMPADHQGDWTTAPLPAPAEADYPGVSLAGGSSLVIFRDSPQKELAFRLIEYVAGVQAQVEFYRVIGDLPARVAAWDDPAIAGEPRLAAFREQLRHVDPMPRVPEWERIAWAIAEAAERVILGQQSADASLGQLQTEVDRMLAKRRFLLDRRARERTR
ncbi:MAG TPA: sugar ABC transporter substrate-binding protein [Thermoanaerobaculaceae bacterium]|nr:sugar ABC transporter substrate-binding protein [Thermoanaerobaculaceae bacterium]